MEAVVTEEPQGETTFPSFVSKGINSFHPGVVPPYPPAKDDSRVKAGSPTSPAWRLYLWHSGYSSYIILAKTTPTLIHA